VNGDPLFVVSRLALVPFEQGWLFFLDLSSRFEASSPASGKSVVFLELIELLHVFLLQVSQVLLPFAADLHFSVLLVLTLFRTFSLLFLYQLLDAGVPVALSLYLGF